MGSQNRYQLICIYCDFSWGVNYIPEGVVYCQKCTDSNVRAIEVAKDRVDYYIGTPMFEDEEPENWNM